MLGGHRRRGTELKVRSRSLEDMVSDLRSVLFRELTGNKEEGQGQSSDSFEVGMHINIAYLA